MSAPLSATSAARRPARVEIRNASVHMPIYNARGRDLKATLLSKVGGRVETGPDRAVTVVHALDNINLLLEEGSRIGLVGHNGAGKSTLLRLIARIYPPTSGTVIVEGRVAALTDLTMGMDFEATGVENIVMRGVLMGQTRTRARALVDEIAEFAELGPFLDLPVRTYSSGMMLRLAFALSTAFEPDILVLDEIIGAGDAAFQRKARDRLDRLVTRARIVVLASHDDALLESMCDTALWLEGGRIKVQGPVAEVLAQYHGRDEAGG